LIGLAEIIVAKHRNGAVGDIKLRFRKEQAKFTDLDDMEFVPISAIDTMPAQAITYRSKMNEDPLPLASGDNDFDFLSGPLNEDLPY
jgi:replicative DNA helicase